MSEESEKQVDVEAGGPESASTPGDDCGGDEFVIPGPPLPGGARMCLHHDGDHTVRAGVMKPMEEGKPIDDSAMLLERREGTGIYNVLGTMADLKKGPSKVNSSAFKRGWDNVFGKKTTVGQA